MGHTVSGKGGLGEVWDTEFEVRVGNYGTDSLNSGKQGWTTSFQIQLPTRQL